MVMRDVIFGIPLSAEIVVKPLAIRYHNSGSLRYSRYLSLLDISFEDLKDHKEETEIAYSRS